MFKLDPQLVKDTVVLGYFPLSAVLLSRDANFPWCILVPMREDIREIYQLDEVDRLQLIRESCYLAEGMDSLFAPDKMNVGALGNTVPQLHLHHVARFKTDPAWPRAVWGMVEPAQYSTVELTDRVNRLRSALARSDFKVADQLPSVSKGEMFSP